MTTAKSHLSFECVVLGWLSVRTEIYLYFHSEYAEYSSYDMNQTNHDTIQIHRWHWHIVTRFGYQTMQNSLPIDLETNNNTISMSCLSSNSVSIWVWMTNLFNNLCQSRRNLPAIFPVQMKEHDKDKHKDINSIETR